MPGPGVGCLAARGELRVASTVPGASSGAGARTALGATIISSSAATSASQNAKARETPRSIGTAASSSARARRELEVEPSRGKEAALLVAGGHLLEVRQ
jgi:hypothetical protein